MKASEIEVLCYKFLAMALSVIIVLLLCSCALLDIAAPSTEGAAARGDGQTACFREIYYLDTYIDITLYSWNDNDGETALDEAEAVFQRVDGLFDRFDEASEIYRINNAAREEREEGSVKVSSETFYLLKTALEYCAQSGGAFDIGMGAVSDLWDFKADIAAIIGATATSNDVPSGSATATSNGVPTGSATATNGVPTGSPPDPGELAKALAVGGYKKIILHEEDLSVETPQGMSIDLGGIAKGYAVREAAAALERAGVISAVIDAGGNVHVIGGKRSQNDIRPMNVGIRHPRPKQKDELLAIVSVKDKSVVTSGDYNRYFMSGDTRYHHILDPSTGAPAHESISATIIADDSALADYLSTAVFVLGAIKGLELIATYPGVEAIIVAPDMSVFTSPGFDGEILSQ